MGSTWGIPFSSFSNILRCFRYIVPSPQGFEGWGLKSLPEEEIIVGNILKKALTEVGQVAVRDDRIPILIGFSIQTRYRYDALIQVNVLSAKPKQFYRPYIAAVFQ